MPVLGILEENIFPPPQFPALVLGTSDLLFYV